MGRLSQLSWAKLGRRPAECRVLLQYRASPAVVEECLTGARPSLVRGYALVGICYARLGPSSWLLRRVGHGAEILSYRLAVEDEGGDRESREFRTLDARHARFAVEEEGFGITLTVRVDDREELHLRAEAHGTLSGSIFASAREAGEFLATDAPELESGTHTLESLTPREIRCTWLAGSSPFPPGSLELDSAFRLVMRRSQPVIEPSLEARLVPGSPASVQPIP